MSLTGKPTGGRARWPTSRGRSLSRKPSIGFLGQFAADARFYHDLTRAGRSGAGLIAWTLLRNRACGFSRFIGLLTFACAGAT